MSMVQLLLITGLLLIFSFFRYDIQEKRRRRESFVWSHFPHLYWHIWSYLVITFVWSYLCDHICMIIFVRSYLCDHICGIIFVWSYVWSFLCDHFWSCYNSLSFWSYFFFILANEETLDHRSSILWWSLSVWIPISSVNSTLVEFSKRRDLQCLALNVEPNQNYDLKEEKKDSHQRAGEEKEEKSQQERQEEEKEE